MMSQIGSKNGYNQLNPFPNQGMFGNPIVKPTHANVLPIT